MHGKGRVREDRSGCKQKTRAKFGKKEGKQKRSEVETEIKRT
jgi:hypothetical protein